MLNVWRLLFTRTLRFQRLNNWIWYRKHAAFLKTCGAPSLYGW